MKTLRKMAMLLLVSSVTFSACLAQEFKKSIQTPAKITISSFFGELLITGVAGNDLVIKAEGYEPPSPRADGLKPIYSGGEENTGIGLSFEQEGNQISLMGASKQSGHAIYYISLPENVAVSVDLSSPFAKDIEVKNMKEELEIESLNSDITLLDITGPVVIHSISGEINAEFSSLSQKNPSSVTTVSGKIDLTLPANGPANIEISTITGEIYSNLDITYDKPGKEGMKRIGGHTVEGNLGNGGVAFEVSCISGEIYLRKK